MRPLILLCLFVFGLAAGGPDTAAAQTTHFGQNRVPNETVDWRTLHSVRTDVYFAAGTDDLATLAAATAEEALTALELLFDVRVDLRIPILVYPAHPGFAATNAVELPVGALGIGGVTEPFKNRVVLPFSGDRYAFRRVLRHELVHAVMNQMLYGGSVRAAMRQRRGANVPLWFSEGLAEVASRRLEDVDDGFVRAAVLSGELPDLAHLDGYAAYRFGESLWSYLVDVHGRTIVAEVLARLRRVRSVEAALESTLGVNEATLSARWKAWLRATTAADDGRLVHARIEAGDAFAVSPALSPDGVRIAYATARGGRAVVAIETIPSDGGSWSWSADRVPVGTPGLAWSPDGRTLAVAAGEGRTEGITLLDPEGHVHRRLVLPDIDQVHSVGWAPDGTRLVASVLRRGQSDLVVVDARTGGAADLTFDASSDLEPSWSPDGAWIAFHSDRASPVDPGRLPAARHALFRIHPDGSGLERLGGDHSGDDSGHRPWHDTSPRFGKTPGLILFRSDRDDAGNVFALDIATGRVDRLATGSSPATGLTVSADGRRAAFVAYAHGRPAVHLLDDPFDSSSSVAWTPPAAHRQALAAGMDRPFQPVQDLTVDVRHWNFGPGFADGARSRPLLRAESSQDVLEAVSVEEPPRRYRASLSPDLAFGGAIFDPFHASRATAHFLLSDVPGDHVVSVDASLVSRARHSNVQAQYAYRAHRVDWTVSVFHLSGPEDPGPRRSRLVYAGAALGARIPLDRNRRLEAELTFAGTQAQSRSRVSVPIPSIAYVLDYSEPGYLAPRRGIRAVLRARAIPHRTAGFGSMEADVRGYVPIGGHGISMALRGSAGASAGRGRPRFYAGGVANWIDPQGRPTVDWPWAIPFDPLSLVPVQPLRGFSLDAAGGDRFALANAELRVPLRVRDRGWLPFVCAQVFADAAAFGGGGAPNVLAGVGYGLRIVVAGLPIRLDAGRAFDGRSLGRHRLYLSIGPDF